jgi:hypothetical protein
VLSNITNFEIAFGISTKLWFGITVMIFAFFLLANIQNTLEFNTAISFILIYLVSVAFLFLISQNIDAKKHLEHLHTFWMNDINARQLIWIPIGIAGVFASVGVSIAVDFPLLGIFLSGGVMMFIFLKTNAILIPIIVHGIYNSFVISLKQGAFDIGATFLQQTPIRVPEVGIGIQGISSLYSEVIWQFMLVATAEEVMKIAILVFVVLALTARFPRNQTATYIGAGVAIGLWGIMHTIQALSI